jgi:GntP family gluconate:H+ symporter
MVLGELLSKSGGAEELGKAMLRFVGKKKDNLAINITGYILAVPIHLLSALVMLLPFVRSMSKITKRSMASYATALLIGLILTHTCVVPTPGPLAIAGMLKANLGWFLLYGLIITLPATLLVGWGGSQLVERWALKGKNPHEPEQVQEEEEFDLTADPTKPSAKLTLGLIALPIFLILLNTIAGVILPADSKVMTILSFLGNNHIALFIGALVAMIALRKYFKDEAINSVFEKCLTGVGSLFMLLGAGNALGTVIATSGMGDFLVQSLSGLNLSIVVLGFVLCLILRIVMGLGVVAAITVTSILGPTVLALGASPVLFGLAVCAASFGFLGPFDPTFWMFGKFYDMDFKQTIVAITIPTAAACLICFGVIMILNAFSSVLPGLI